METTNIINQIGNTPLIKLKQVSDLTGCNIYGKAEYFNPGESVKDRAALSILTDAISSGRLKPGGTIVEGSAGNTGIGLTLIGASMGFSTVIVIPETQSKEKKDVKNKPPLIPIIAENIPISPMTLQVMYEFGNLLPKTK